jgi:hypothetical protein
MKVIHALISAPGSGKTEAFLTRLPALIEANKHLILALPTLVLSDDIGRRASKAGINFRTIDQRSGEAVVFTLEKTLEEKIDAFVICTQESMRHVRHELLQGWVLVIDELPKVVDYPDYALKPVELKRVFDFTEEHGGQLWIKNNLEQAVREQVLTNRKDGQGPDSSTLGKAGAHIFRLLLSNVDVFIDQSQLDGIRHVRAVEEFTNWWGIMAAAMEIHVFAANLQKSEFELFAKIHGFRFIESMLTSSINSSVVTIYPIVQKGRYFSKRMMLATHGSERLIDFVLMRALSYTTSTPLVFANKWARLQFRSNIEYAPKDCRGLNKYAHATEAIVLFGGNPSPSDSKGIEYLNAKYKYKFEESFIVTRLLEPSLQAVTRTAVRRKDNTEDIHFYVQDERVANYLVSTYFSDAKVDWTFAELFPVKRDGRRINVEVETEINRLIALGTSTKQIHRQTGVSAQKIRKMKNLELVKSL